MRRIGTIGAMVLVLLGGWNVPARAQINPSGTLSFQDASGGAVRGRSPGNLVSSGVGRHQQFLNDAFSIPQITEVQLPSRRTTVLVAVLTQAFAEINAFLDQFANLLIARAEGTNRSNE